MDLRDLDALLESGAKGKDKITPTSNPTFLWREWKAREVAAEEQIDINPEDNSSIDQNKVQKRLKAEGSSKKATIITTGDSSAINGEKRMGVSSSLREKVKVKVKARVGAKVGTKVTGHIPVDTWLTSVPKHSNQNTPNPK